MLSSEFIPSNGEEHKRIGGGLMPYSLNPADLRKVVADAHARERAELAALAEDARIRVGTPLPGWTRAHVLASRLVFLRAALRQIQYALAGETTAFYRTGADPKAADKAARDEELASHAARPAADLVAEVGQATVVLDDAFARLTPDDWTRPARYRGGGTLTDVLFAAWRECEVHRVDYGLEVRPRDWSAEFCEHMLDYLARRVPADLSLRLCTPDGAARTVGSGGEVLEVHGALTDLAAWLGGRTPDGRLTTADGHAAPELSRVRNRRAAPARAA